MCHVPHCNNYTPQGEFYCLLHSGELMPAGDIPTFMKEKIYAQNKKAQAHKRVSRVPRKETINITKKSYSVRPTDPYNFDKTPGIVRTISAILAIILTAIVSLMWAIPYTIKYFLKKD